MSKQSAEDHPSSCAFTCSDGCQCRILLTHELAKFCPFHECNFATSTISTIPPSPSSSPWSATSSPPALSPNPSRVFSRP
jgi:hypothetical protein